MARAADDRGARHRHAAQTMKKGPPENPAETETETATGSGPPARFGTGRAATLAPPRRFSRSDGRFDLPVVTGRTPREVARRLA
jgi:hypothetical protein